MNDIYNIYAYLAFSQTMRIIGLIDRDAESKTSGCCFPYYWKYKILDFPNMKAQENVLFFSLSYLLKHKDNILYKKKYTLNICKAIISFWIKNRNKDGSVAEQYLNEHCFCATAYSTLYILLTIHLLNPYCTDFNGYLKDIEKPIKWLATNKPLNISNQLIAAIVSIFLFQKLTKTTKYNLDLQTKTNYLLDNLFDQSGYFIEYDGYDYGYQTISLSLLTIMKRILNNSKFDPIIKKGHDFISKIYDEFGHFSNLKTSRKTQYTYPSSFVSLNNELLLKNANGLKNNKIISPQWLDDRYAPSLSIDYLLTLYYGTILC